MRQGPTSIPKEKAGSLREFLHELRFQPPLQSNQVVLPGLVEEMIKDFSDGRTFGSNLKNFTDRAGSEPVNVPSVDLPFLITKYDLAKITESVPLFHKFEHPLQGFAIVTRN